MNNFKIILLLLILASISCKEEIETMLETDYKVIEITYDYDNYLNNIKEKSEQIIIKERNLIFIEVNKKGEFIIEKKIVKDSMIVSELKKYLIPNPENNQMPITIEKEFKHSGKVVMNKNFIVLAKFNKELDYKEYSKIRNKIYSAFNEVRNEFSKEKFNKTMNELMNSDEENDYLRWSELKKIFPFHYTEVIEE